MMPATAAPHDPSRVLSTEARALSLALPELMVAARQVAHTLTMGWHGRRRAGAGENFWQFRAFHSGESASAVDWRRSGRDEQLYVREREAQNAHTLWLWADLSPSMLFCSPLSATPKRDRALVVLFALADLLARAGERIGLLGSGEAIASRNAAERLARALLHGGGDTHWPPPLRVGRFHEVIIFSDCFESPDLLVAEIKKLTALDARVHLVQVLDPAEESFPYRGRIEFSDPENGERLIVGRAEGWRAAYRERLVRHRDALRQAVSPSRFVVHHTDRPAVEAVLALYHRLSQAGGTDTPGNAR